MVTPRPPEIDKRPQTLSSALTGSCDRRIVPLPESQVKVHQIFVSYEELRAKFGKNVEKLPLGAVGNYTATQKIRTGLQQLMVGRRTFNLSTITRRDLMSLSEECEKVTGIPYVMRAYRKEAEEILAQ